MLEHVRAGGSPARLPADDARPARLAHAQCRAALAARGFELPVAPRKAKKGAPAGPKRRGLLRKRAADPREVRRAVGASRGGPLLSGRVRRPACTACAGWQA